MQGQYKIIKMKNIDTNMKYPTPNRENHSLFATRNNNLWRETGHYTIVVTMRS